LIYAIGLVAVALALVGFYLIYSGASAFWLTVRRWRYLIEADGVVVRHIRDEPTTNLDGGTVVLSYRPVVRFQNRQGQTTEFSSAFGSNDLRQKHPVGSRMPVLFDPDGVLPPRIRSWSSLWGTSLLLVVGGLIFLGGAALASAVVVIKGPVR
jgi:hypothetical protein